MPQTRVLNLSPFLAVVRDLTALLGPIKLRSEFKETLGASLVLAARQSYAHAALDTAAHALPAVEVPLLNWGELPTIVRERHWAIGAAALGSVVSVAGIIAYLRYQRNQRAA